MRLKEFIQDIGIPEFKAVIGKGGNRIFIITVMFFVTLLVLGVAHSSSELLIKKMQEPYIRYVDVRKPMFVKPGKSEISNKTAKKLINDPSLDLSAEFSKGTNKRFKFRINFIEKTPLGMLITENDLFYKSIKSGSEKSILTKSTFSDDGFGLILTKEFFADFGITDDSWNDIAFVEVSIKNIYVKLPVAEVVEELRNNCKFAFSKNFLNCVSNNKDVFKRSSYKGTSTYFLPNIDTIPSDIHSSFALIDVRNILSSNCYKKGIMVYSQDTTAVIENEAAVKVLDIRKVSTEPDQFDIDYFTFHLNDLSKIEHFAERIKELFDISIEQGKIEEKKNIDFFNAIIHLLYLAVGVFSILSIILFIVNVLISHLNSNKRSLGTLKAFGLSNSYIVGLYSGIALFLVGASFIIAYISTELIGPFALRLLLGDKTIGDLIYVNMSSWVLVPFMVFMPVVIILAMVFKYLHNVTPGDLIYERK